VVSKLIDVLAALVHRLLLRCRVLAIAPECVEAAPHVPLADLLVDVDRWRIVLRLFDLRELSLRLRLANESRYLSLSH
jgi:hypothetical protein